MLQTINGFDLLLVIVIVLLVFKIQRLNNECNDYVRQIIQVSWELQQEIQASKYDPELYEPAFKPASHNDCAYCAGVEEFITGDECICVPF
jgi:hypothetical protein